MRGSDVTIAPLGRFFSEANGDREYNLPILAVGVETALIQVEWNNVEKFFDRGGVNARKSAIASIASHTRT